MQQQNDNELKETNFELKRKANQREGERERKRDSTTHFRVRAHEILQSASENGYVNIYFVLTR